jgi:spoIIIJ-associated protein
VSGAEVSVEAAGETVGEAKWAALRELERLRPGLDKAAVRFQVVSEGERGLLGVGFTPARVVASVEDTGEPAPLPVAVARPGEGPEAAAVRELLERAAQAIGARCEITVDEDDDEIRAVAHGGDLGLLIGRHGQTIDALQYLANAIAGRASGTERRRVVVDAAGYRDRRAAALEAIAGRAAERASATGQPVALEPMSAVERRVVHEVLKEDPEVETASEGTEPNRHVVVLPRRSV